MYKCDANASCEAINGYVKVNTDYYEITVNGVTGKVAQSNPGCSESNIGQIFKDGGNHYICLDNGFSKQLAAGYYILGNGSGYGPFAGDSKKMIIISTSENYIYVDTEFTGKYSLI